MTRYPPEFQVTVEGDREICIPIIRDEIYKITAEALRNAFRHAQAGGSRLRFVTTRSNSDCVCGTMERASIQPFSPARVVRDTTVCPGCRERATVIGGKLTVWSEVDAGTEVELRVPANVAYATGPKTFVAFPEVCGKA